jgi:hypothetical protein
LTPVKAVAAGGHGRHSGLHLRQPVRAHLSSAERRKSIRDLSVLPRRRLGSVRRSSPAAAHDDERLHPFSTVSLGAIFAASTVAISRDGSPARSRSGRGPSAGWWSPRLPLTQVRSLL